MTVGKRIKMIRKTANISQKDLAIKLGVSASMIGQYENDLRNPKYETVERIAKALDVSVDMLYYGEEPDRDYEDLLDVLSDAGLATEATGFMDNYYVWHTDAEDPVEDRVELEYEKLLSIVTAAKKASELKKIDYLRKRLDADIF